MRTGQLRLEMGRLLRASVLLDKPLSNTLRKAAALALQNVVDEAHRYMPYSADSMVNVKPLSEALGLPFETIDKLVDTETQDRFHDGMNDVTEFEMRRRSRQSVIEVFNAAKYIAYVDSTRIPRPTALAYNTQRDERVRKTHDELEGMTLAFDDPLWSIYYPPNDFNCRCFVRAIFGEFHRQLPRKRYTPPKEFKRNYGESLVYTPV